jgi:hypothetical protein
MVLWESKGAFLMTGPPTIPKRLHLTIYFSELHPSPILGEGDRIQAHLHPIPNQGSHGIQVDDVGSDGIIDVGVGGPNP